MARPTRYNKEKHCKLAALVAPKGFDDKEIAEILGISERSLGYWKVKYPEFLQALKGGKSQANEQVKAALFTRCLGFEHKEIKVFCSREGDSTEKEQTTYYPPDVRAIEYWLNNRDKENWRNVKSVEVAGPGGKPVEYKEISDQDLDKQIAEAEAKLANTKSGKSKKP